MYAKLVALFGLLCVVVVVVRTEDGGKCFDHEHDEEVNSAQEACKDEPTEKNQRFICEMKQLKVVTENGFDCERAKELIDRLAIDDKKQKITESVEKCKEHEKDVQKYLHCIHVELKGFCSDVKITKDDPEE